jgi:hypothetical protein
VNNLCGAIVARRLMGLVATTEKHQFYTIPKFAISRAKQCSAAEEFPSRSIQVILPRGNSTNDYLRQLRSWPCIEEAHSDPALNLP